MQTDSSLPEPTLDYVQKRLRDRDDDTRLRKTDDVAVGLVFQHWPANTDAAQVLVKVTVLNQLYSTQIRAVQVVANHIASLNIDERLRQGDLSLVHDIGLVQLKSEEKPHFLLSFASKYCSWHEPEQFQIFDSLVEGLLFKYQCQFSFASYQRDELHNYPQFIQVIDQFRSHFGLSSIGRKRLDNFLWYEAKYPLQAASASP